MHPKSPIPSTKTTPSAPTSPPKVTHLTNLLFYNSAINYATHQNKPIVIYISLQLSPTCKAFTPKYENFASNFIADNARRSQNEKVEFYQVEYNSEMSSMVKVGAQHCPIVMVMKGTRCQTLLRPEMRELEKGMEEVFR